MQPESFWYSSRAAGVCCDHDALQRLQARSQPKVLHGVGSPVGGSALPDPARVALLAEAFDGYWLDAHCGAIPDAVVSVGRELVADLPNLRLVSFEILPAFLAEFGEGEVVAQLERRHEIWQARRSGDLPQTVEMTRPAPARPTDLPLPARRAGLLARARLGIGWRPGGSPPHSGSTGCPAR